MCRALGRYQKATNSDDVLKIWQQVCAERLALYPIDASVRKDSRVFLRGLLRILLQLRDMAREELFVGHPQFADAPFRGFKEAYKRLSPSLAVEVGELLSLALDQMLDRTKNDGAGGDRFELILRIASQVVEEEAFQHFYAHHLAKRLLRERHRSIKEEMETLARIDPARVMHTAQRMLKDITDSVALASKFKASLIEQLDVQGATALNAVTEKARLLYHYY